MNARFLQKNWVIAILALIAAFMWGSAYPTIKISYQLWGLENSNAASKMLFAGIRFIFAGIVILIVMSVIRHELQYPKLKNIWKITLLGMVQTGVQYIFFYIGLANTSGSKSAIISGTATILSRLMSGVVFRDDRLSIRKMAGSLIAFIAIIIVNVTDNWGGLHMTLVGEGFMFISSIAFAMGAVGCRIVTKTEDAAIVSGYQLIVGGIMLALLGGLSGGRITKIDITAILVLVYLILLSSIAYLLWTLLLSVNSVSRVSIYYSFVPVFGVILSALLLNEHVMNSRCIIALLLICAAIGIVYSEDL